MHIIYWLRRRRYIYIQIHTQLTGHISFWDQFSCYVTVINIVAVCNLLPQITGRYEIPIDFGDLPVLVFFFGDIMLYYNGRVFYVYVFIVILCCGNHIICSTFRENWFQVLKSQHFPSPVREVRVGGPSLAEQSTPWTQKLSPVFDKQHHSSTRLHFHLYAITGLSVAGLACSSRDERERDPVEWIILPVYRREWMSTWQTVSSTQIWDSWAIP